MDKEFIISEEMLEKIEEHRRVSADGKLFDSLTNTAKSKPNYNYPSASHVGRLGMAERLNIAPFAFEMMIIDAARQTGDETIVGLFEELILAVSLRGYESIASIAAINERVENDVKRRQEKINIAKKTLEEKFPDGRPGPYSYIDPQWSEICDRAEQSYTNAQYRLENMTFEDKVFFVILAISSRYFSIYGSGSISCDFENMRKFNGAHISDITKKYTAVVKGVHTGDSDTIREVNRLTGNKLHTYYDTLGIKLS